MSVASIVAAVGPVSAVETLVVTGAIAPVAAGNAFKVTLVGTVLSNVQVPVTFNLRMGTTGTIADALVASVSPVVNDFDGAQAFECSFISTARTTTVFDAFSNVQGNGNGSVIGITEVNPAPVTLGGVPSALTVSAVGAIQIVDVATMASGSANVTLTSSNSLAPSDLGNINIGSPVAFAATVGNFGTGTVYYIVGSNAGTASASATVQLSATVGGTPIVASATGTTNASLAYNAFVTVNQAVIQLM